MRRGQRTTAAERVSVPVSSDEARRAHKHLDVVGLPPRSSKAEIIHSFFERGLRDAEREKREKAELDAYTAYERDPERRAVAGEISQAALKSGAL